MGIVAQRSGSIRLGGRELVNLAPHRIGRAGIAYCPDDRGIYASLTVRENLLLPPVVVALLIFVLRASPASLPPRRGRLDPRVPELG